LIQFDLLLNIILLLRPFLNDLIVLVDLRAQLLDLGRLGRRRRVFSGGAFFCCWSLSAIFCFSAAISLFA